MEMRLEELTVPGLEEKMRVVVEMEEQEMKVMCEGYCDLDKV